MLLLFKRADDFLPQQLSTSEIVTAVKHKTRPPYRRSTRSLYGFDRMLGGM